MNIIRLNNLLGYEDTISKLRRPKVVEILSKRIRYSFDENGVDIKQVMTEAEFVIYSLVDGCYLKTDDEKPCHKCNVPFCPEIRGGECSKGKIVYSLWKDHIGTVITKTAYDFGTWLQEQGLTNIEAIEARKKLVEEKIEQERFEAVRKEGEIKAQKAKAQQEREEYQKWFADKVYNYGGIGTPEGAKILIQRDIFMNMYGEYDVDRAKDLLVLIDNIDNPHCRRELISRLHNGNAASIKTFECVTGIKLPSTYKARKSFLETVSKDDYKEAKQYKPRKEAVATEYNDIYYTHRRTGDGKYEFVESLGLLWKYNEFDFYIQKRNNYYAVTEGRSGMSVHSDGKSLEDAKKRTRDFLKGREDKILEQIKSANERFGLSPLYRDKQEAM